MHAGETLYQLSYPCLFLGFFGGGGGCFWWCVCVCIIDIMSLSLMLVSRFTKGVLFPALRKY